MPLMIAVDLGSHAVKVTTYRTSGRRVALEDRLSFPVPQNGTPPTLASRLTALEALMDEHQGWTGGSASIGFVMPGSEVSFRPMRLPFTDRAKVDQTLPFAIEEEVPFDMANMQLGYRVEKRGESSEVMAALTVRKVLDGYLAAFKELGMDPRSVVPDGELYADYGGADEVVAVVDIGHTRTNVALVDHGRVRACRAISVGGHSFTSAIQSAMQCEWSQAEAIKHGQIADNDATEGAQKRSGYANLQPAARQAVDAAIGQLLAEIRSSLIRFEDSLGAEVQAVRLCGGSARIPELWNYLSTDLGIPVTAAVDPEGGGTVIPTHATADAMGRLLAGQGDLKPIELRTGSYAFQGGGNTLRAVLTYGTAGAVFFAMAAFGIFVYQYVDLLAQRADVNERINAVVLETFPEIPPDQLDSRDKAEALMVGFTMDTIRTTETLPPANPEKPEKTDLLAQLIKALPPHEEVAVDLTNLDLLHNVISFEGETEGFAQSAKIEETLVAVDSFSRTTKDSESRTPQGRVKFKFSIPLGKDEEKEG